MTQASYRRNKLSNVCHTNDDYRQCFCIDDGQKPFVSQMMNDCCSDLLTFGHVSKISNNIGSPSTIASCLYRFSVECQNKILSKVIDTFEKMSTYSLNKTLSDWGKINNY